MQFKKRILQVGDKVKIIDSLYSNTDYASELDDYIGVTAEISDISSDGNHELSVDSELWWYPSSCLQYIGDIEHIKIDKIRPKQRLFVGKPLTMLNLRTVNKRLTRDNIDFILYDNSVYESMFGKTGIVIDSNYSVSTYHDLFGEDDWFSKKDEYIGLNFDGKICYLPLCALFNNNPTYNSRIISKTI